MGNAPLFHDFNVARSGGALALGRPGPVREGVPCDRGFLRLQTTFCAILGFGAPHAATLTLSPQTDKPLDILGIDIGGSGIKGAVVNTVTGELLTERLRYDTPQPATPAAMASVVGRLTRDLGWQGPIGAAFPARIKKGVALTAANIDKSWIGQSAANLFSDATGCPVTVLNDADAAGVASMHFGAARGRGGFVCFLTFGTGIGSALFMDGVLIPNTEFGHIWLKGQVAEHYASDKARKDADLDWKVWAGRVQDYLDRIEFLLAPDVIILGGSISKAKKRDKYFHYLRTNAELVTATLENEAGIIGAAMTAAQLAAKAEQTL